MNEEQAKVLINRALGTDYKDFATIVKTLKETPTPNEQLVDMLNKITKMFVSDSFNSTLLEKWSNSFLNTNDRLEIGALAEIVDTALLTAQEDTIATNTDLLPDLSAIPSQYVKRMARTFSKRIELVVNNSVFERAFTSIQAFNSFINIVTKRVKDSMVKSFYDYIFTDILKQIKNVITVNPTDPAGDNYAVNMNKIYSLIAANTPYSNKFNVLSADGIVIKSLDIDNARGIDIPTKINTIELSREGNDFKFPSLICLTGGGILQSIEGELSEVFHNEVLNPHRKFKDVIVIQNDIYQALRIAFGIDVASNEFLFFVLDERTLVNLTFLETLKSQFWAKGQGSGLLQNVLSQWNAVGLIPWGNGGVFKFKYKAPTTPPPASIPAPPPPLGSKSGKKDKKIEELPA